MTTSNTAETPAPAFADEAPSGTRRRPPSLAELRRQAREASLQWLGAEFAPSPVAPPPPAPPAPRPAPPAPEPTSARVRRLGRALVQLDLIPLDDARRHLPVIGPRILDPFTGCLDRAERCPHRDCREHLGDARAFDGETFSCAIDVANAYPGGLPPHAVGALLGETEAAMLRLERTIAEKYPGVTRDLAGLYALAFGTSDDDDALADDFVADD